MKREVVFMLILISQQLFAQKGIVRDSIPLGLNEQNTIFVTAVFNQTDTLILNFDTGTTELILTNTTLNNKVKKRPQLYDSLYTVKIGTTTYQTKVYDAELAGHGTDGRFGWDLFKGKIVELNYDLNLMIVHTVLPDHVNKDKRFSKLKMEFFKGLLLVKTEIKQDGIINSDLFLFDTGYQRTVMLDNDLLKRGKFPTEKMEVLKKVIMRGAQGNEIPVITSNLKQLKIGTYTLKNVPVQQITTNKPIRNVDIHILGNEVLKRFNYFLDFRTNSVYLRSNHLFNEGYIEQKRDS